MSNKQSKRKQNHNYKAPFKYHITITKQPGIPIFSSLIIKELTPQGVKLNYSSTGIIIYRNLKSLSEIEPKIRLLQYIIMPDHVHLLIQVTQTLEEHLGKYISKLKSTISRQLHYTSLQQSPHPAKPNDNQIQIKPVFEEGYNDKIIYPDRNLHEIFQYIRSNPYRLAVRIHRPDFFQKSRNISTSIRLTQFQASLLTPTSNQPPQSIQEASQSIQEAPQSLWEQEKEITTKLQAYGNLFLLNNPFKTYLIVHRADTPEQFELKKEECLYTAVNGGVIISAFISPREKEIRSEIEAVGGSMIIVHATPFEEREKPSRHYFELCAEGKIAMVAPFFAKKLKSSDHPSRQHCKILNKIAEALANQPKIK